MINEEKNGKLEGCVKMLKWIKNRKKAKWLITDRILADKRRGRTAVAILAALCFAVTVVALAQTIAAKEGDYYSDLSYFVYKVEILDASDNVVADSLTLDGNLTVGRELFFPHHMQAERLRPAVARI